jgi:hypothetical protein
VPVETWLLGFECVLLCAFALGYFFGVLAVVDFGTGTAGEAVEDYGLDSY